MSLQNFVDGSLPAIKAAWLNLIDAFYATLFNSATTPAEARDALSSAVRGANDDITSMSALSAPTAAANPLRAGDLQGQLVTAFTTTGSGTAYVLTPTPAATALVDGLRFRVMFHTAAGASPTLNVSGLGVANLKYMSADNSLQTPTSAQLPGNWVCDVEYRNTCWIMLQIARDPYGIAVGASAAAAGAVGESMESVVATVNAPATTVWGDLTSIGLPAGDWEISAMVTGELNGATLTTMSAGISTTAGNSAAGLTYGTTRADMLPTTANTASVTFPPRRVVGGFTTYYLKMNATYSAGTPRFYGRITARRMR